MRAERTVSVRRSVCSQAGDRQEDYDRGLVHVLLVGQESYQGHPAAGPGKHQGNPQLAVCNRTQTKPPAHSAH